MAKRKTTQGKNTRPKKITEDPWKKTHQPIQTLDYLQMELGKADVKKYGILKGIENIQTELDLMRQEYKKEYGTDNISLEDGTIKYEENEQANQKNQCR